MPGLQYLQGSNSPLLPRCTPAPLSPRSLPQPSQFIVNPPVRGMLFTKRPAPGQLGSLFLGWACNSGRVTQRALRTQLMA
jgi:hypothetical protein